jgi:hypothetical protein
MSESVAKYRAPLPATVEDLLAHRSKIAPPNLNDKVETLYLALYPDPVFQRLLDAVHSEDAQEGSLYADDIMAAEMLRDYAVGEGKDPYVAGKKLATIARALNIVQARYNLTRKMRAKSVGGSEIQERAAA